MKNKIIVMFLTFIVMIALTPLIFGKLMNSKFDTMILKISQQYGLQIKEIKNKSTYLTTDRIFDVIVPGSAVKQKAIKYIEFQTESKFKNLPVTEVEFFNTLKKIVLDNNKTVSLPENKFKIVVITPDFKIYKYKILNNDINLKKANALISWKDFNGVFDEKNRIFKNENGLLELKNDLNNLKIYNIKTFLQDLDNKKIQQLHFDVNFSNPKLKLQMVNFNSNSTLKILNNTVNIHSASNFDEINANNMLKISNVRSDFEISGVDKTVYERLQNKKYTQNDIDKLLKEGFNGKFDLNIKNIFFMQNLGFLDLKSIYSIKNGSLDKINHKDFSFLDLNLTVKTTPEIFAIASKIFPHLSQMAIKKGNKKIINIQIKKGKIIINGQEIKSN